jgi:hypothetical protein
VWGAEREREREEERGREGAAGVMYGCRVKIMGSQNMKMQGISSLLLMNVFISDSHALDMS